MGAGEWGPVLWEAGGLTSALEGLGPASPRPLDNGGLTQRICATSLRPLSPGPPLNPSLGPAQTGVSRALLSFVHNFQSRGTPDSLPLPPHFSPQSFSPPDGI